MKKLTPSVNAPSDPQVGKTHERLLSAARKSGVTSQQFQVALAYPGTELEDELLAVFVRFAKKVRGIITPVSAEDSGLIPNGWTVRVKDGVRQDFPEGEVDLAKLDYSICPVQDGDDHYVNGDTMLQRAIKAKAYGSLGFAAVLLKEQKEGKEIFPVESRGKYYFIMPLTELFDGRRDHRVACFDWGDERWVLSFPWLDSNFNDNARFVRPRE